jgi:hypothetical protein
MVMNALTYLSIDNALLQRRYVLMKRYAFTHMDCNENSATRMGNHAVQFDNDVEFFRISRRSTRKRFGESGKAEGHAEKLKCHHGME